MFTFSADSTGAFETADDLIVVVTGGPETSATGLTRIRRARIVFVYRVVGYETLVRQFVFGRPSVLGRRIQVGIMPPTLDGRLLKQLRFLVFTFAYRCWIWLK